MRGLCSLMLSIIPTYFNGARARAPVAVLAAPLDHLYVTIFFALPLEFRKHRCTLIITPYCVSSQDLSHSLSRTLSSECLLAF